MNTYRIKQYKIYTLDYTVSAETEGEALYRHMEEESKPDLDSLSYVEDPNSIGMNVEEIFGELTEKEKWRILDGEGNFVVGIHSIEEEER